MSKKLHSRLSLVSWLRVANTEAGERALFERDRAGNAETVEERLTQHFIAYREPIFRYLVRLLRNAAEAEELTQEVFLRLYDAMRDGESVSDVRAWTYRVAHNLAVNLRKRGAVFSLLEPEEWSALLDRQADASRNAEQVVLAGEQSDRMEAARKRLSPQERQCMDLRVEGLKYRQIAEALGVSLSTVVTLVSRAIAKIAKETA
jgi:RNA polymerase sigma-70 factor (ECF subfamily)